MKYEKIFAEYTRTVNIGNYESIRLGAHIDVSIDDKDAAKIEKCYDCAFEICKSQVLKQAAELKSALGHPEKAVDPNVRTMAVSYLHGTPPPYYPAATTTTDFTEEEFLGEFEIGLEEVEPINLTKIGESDLAWKLQHPVHSNYYVWAPKKCCVVHNDKITVHEWFREKLSAWKAENGTL